MLLITMVLAQASMVANAAEVGGKYTPRTGSNATISSFMKSIRANQETGLIDPALLIAGQKAAQVTRDGDMDWVSAGPDNYGGETKAIIYDNEGNVIIGTMGGDLFKTTNNGITFQYMAHLDAPINCFAKKDNVLYIGTGDCVGAEELNGLDVLGYEHSFVGSGVYKMEGDTLVLVAGTGDYAFVNEMVVVGDDIYAATSEGLMKNWAKVLDGNFRSVKANPNGDILAADTKDVYLMKVGGEFNKITGTDELPSSDDPKLIALSQSDKNFMYIAYINSSLDDHATGNIYFTDNNGESWTVGYTSSNLYYILNKDANHSSFMTVHPTKPRRIFVGSDNLWAIEDATASGLNSYRPVQISEYNTAEYSAIAWNRYYYLHQGILNIVFDASDPGTFFIGTDGGVYKGEFYASLYSYKSCNRYFITHDEHTSTARMMSVAVGGGTKVIGGSLDAGTVMMYGCDTIDNVTTGYAIFPNPTSLNNTFGYFTQDYAGGPCAISTIKPDIMFVSGTGALDMPIHRTETNGDDYDLTMFSAEDVISNSDAFKTPYALFETYNDAHTSVEIYERFDSLANPLDTVSVLAGDTVYINDNIHITQGHIWAADTAYTYNHITINDTLYTINDTSLYIYNVLHNVIDTIDIYFDTLYLAVRNNVKAGTVCHYYSNQGGYPIDYTMPEPPHDEAHIDTVQGGYQWIQGDTIWGLHDPLKSNMVVGIKNKVYMTRDALIFNKETDWFLISAITGLPTALTMSADGNTAYVGTVAGLLYKFTNLDEVFTAEQASMTDTLNPCVEMYLYDDSLSFFTDRAITSIAVNPSNANEVIVTLGNYGNDNYVYRSNDGGATFESIQGNLGHFPVYSSIIEKSTGLYILGTEHGIFTSSNGASWTKSGHISCPVMELKQAIMENRDDVIDVLYDEMGDATYVRYFGIHNEGMIYAATYGHGIMAWGQYKEGTDFGVDEVMAEGTNVMINVYPNPVRGNAQFNFTMTENAKVIYQVYDITGRMVVNNELGFYTKGEHTATLSTENLKTGSYIIRVIAGNTMSTGKFLVY